MSGRDSREQDRAAAAGRIEVADKSAIGTLDAFFEELREAERARQQGALEGERYMLPEQPVNNANVVQDCERSCFGIDLHTGSPHLDSLRRRLAAAALGALAEVRAGNFDAADASVLAVDRDIQATVMLGAMYTAALREAVQGGGTAQPAVVAALHARALHWRLAAYPEPHTAYEADSYEAGRDEDRVELAALLADAEARG